jgi:hypothetical protein
MRPARRRELFDREQLPEMSYEVPNYLSAAQQEKIALCFQSTGV